MLFICLVVAFVCSFLLTGMYRHIALRKLLLDIPNERSSHRVPTPRGGGISIVVVYVGLLILLHQQLELSLAQVIGFVVPGLLIASVSYIDDLGHVKPLWRLVIQISSVLLGLFYLGGPPNVFISHPSIALQAGFLVAVVLLLVWIINLYNFMDGIDGIASLEAMAVCCGLSFLLWLSLPASGHFLVPLALAISTAGFCCWNFPKAKIFMGDIGSCFIGLQLGLFAIYYSHLDPDFFWCVIILLAAFISDASVTLMRRLVRGQKIYLAHREHAYQQLAIKVGRHGPIAIAYALITLLWLLPIASLVMTMRLNWLIGMLIAYLPLMLTALVLRAGAPAQGVCQTPTIDGVDQ